MPMLITRRIVTRNRSKHDSTHEQIDLIPEGIAAQECDTYSKNLDLGPDVKEDDFLDAWASGKVVYKQALFGPFNVELFYYWHGHKNLQANNAIRNMLNHYREQS